MESAVPAQPSETAVAYTLTREDYVAWWMHQFDRAVQDHDRRVYTLPARLALVALHVLLTFFIAWDLWFWYTGIGSTEKDEGLELIA